MLNLPSKETTDGVMEPFGVPEGLQRGCSRVLFQVLGSLFAFLLAHTLNIDKGFLLVWTFLALDRETEICQCCQTPQKNTVFNNVDDRLYYNQTLYYKFI